MQENPTVLEGILDIEPPAIPLLYVLESNALSITIVSILVIAFLLAATYLLWGRYFSVRGKARRRLDALRNQFNQRPKEQQPNNHHAAYQLCNILRDGLNLKQLSNCTPFPDISSPHKDHWETFIDTLSVARYSPSGYNSEQMATLFEDAGFWLKYWPVMKND